MYAMNQQYFMPQQMAGNPNNNQIPQNNMMLHNNNNNGMKMEAKGKSRGGNQQQQHQMQMMQGGSEKKPKGRMSAYTFFVQTCREEHRKKHPNENVNFTEFSKKCAERWKQMSDKEKKRFSDMAEKDKARYDREMSTYTPPQGEGGRKRKKKDPNAPKRPLSAFFLFCGDERASVKAIYPTYGVGDVAKELGDRWNKVSPETKHKYEEKAGVDKLRYEKEMGVYRGQALKPKVVAAAVPDEDDDDEEDDDNE